MILIFILTVILTPNYVSVRKSIINFKTSTCLTLYMLRIIIYVTVTLT